MSHVSYSIPSFSSFVSCGILCNEEKKNAIRKDSEKNVFSKICYFNFLTLRRTTFSEVFDSLLLLDNQITHSLINKPE